MKKLIFIAILVFISDLIFPVSSSAQGMMGFSSSLPDEAARQSQRQEEQEGKKLLDDVNNKAADRGQLKDADFEKKRFFMEYKIKHLV